MSSNARIVVIAVVAALLAAPIAAAEATAPVTAKIALGKGKRGCAHADAEPTTRNLADVREAILCLHNRIRARAGLPRLGEHGRLRRAALKHSRGMVADGFFAHTTPAGSTMVDRILRARYARRSQGWAFGENLAWGTGRLATARGAVDAWMDSPGHRANILERAYRDVGVGVALGVPVSDAAGATYTVDFGVRR